MKNQSFLNNISPSDNQQFNIIVVDDEPSVRKTISKQLSIMGYNIDTAHDGMDAIQKLEKKSYDLVLTDLKMPNLDGRELLRIMAERFPTIPKIVLTALGNNEDIILALKTGAYDFLTKPISDIAIFQKAIERALETKRLNDKKTSYVNQINQINEVISVLNSGMDTEKIFKALYVSLRKIINFNRLSLLTNDNESNNITTMLVESDRKIFLERGERYDIQSSSLQAVAKKKDVLIINNFREYLLKNPNSKKVKLLLKEGMNSSLVLPLIIDNDTGGFLIFSSDSPCFFKDDHINFLKSIVGQISLSIQRGQLLEKLENQTKSLEELVKKRSHDLVKTQKTTIFALSKLAEIRDPETGEHLERIRNYSLLIAQIMKYSGIELEISTSYLKDLYDSSILHDIGKVGIADTILLKCGPLTSDEFNIMKTHTTIGYNALKLASKDLGDNSFLNMAMDVILFHHERWDGKGYPKGLKEREIPLAARIVAICDVYDALTSKRPYKEPFSHEKTLKIIKEESNHFDPLIKKIFLSSSSEFNHIRMEYSDKGL